MPNPWDAPEYAPKTKTAQELDDEEFNRRMDREFATYEAMDIQSSGYNVPIPAATNAPMVEEAAVKRPKDLVEAGSWLDEARKAHKEHERQLAEFVADTDSIVPTTAESARAIKERAAIIARARRDLADNLKALEDADVNLTQARFLADKNPPDSEGLVGEVGKRLGFMKPLMNLLMAPGDIAKGVVMTGISGIGELTGNSFTQTDVDMGVADWVKAVTLVEPLFNSESKIRQRGRELPRKTGEAVTALMDAYVADTAIMKSFQNATGYENAGKQVAGLAGAAANIFVDLALDPLNVMELGPVTKGGKLRQLAKVNAGATEAVAVSKALQDIPEIVNLLGDLGTAHKIALDGRLTTDLVKAGVDADKATELSKMFDERLVQRLAGYRGIAGVTPKEWSRQVIHELDKLPATEATMAQRAAAQDVWKFGDSVDPINGRSVREQISLGQRGKVLQAFQAKFGDTPWYKAAGKPWAFMVGDSLKHDVADVPEIFAVYTAQRMMRGQAGREFLGFAQDVTEQAAKYLKQFEPQEVAQIQEALPRIVERTDKAGRAELRTSIAERYGKSDLSRAVLDLADLYEESSTTIRAIENRFNLKVADVAGEFGYFGRQFSPELQQFLAEVPSARAWFFNESSRRSKEALDYGLMAPEKGRKLRDFDFTESENLVRNKMRELGYADDMPIWSRDAFGNLADRAKVSQRHAEVRTLYDNFVNVVGTPDAARLQELSAKIGAEIAENQAANIARVEAASEALRKAPGKQAQKALDDAMDAAEHGDMSTWTVDQKARWVEARTKKLRAPENITGLEVLRKANAPLPDNLDDLIKLGATDFTPYQAKQFKNLADGTIWQHIDKPSTFWKVMDGLKRIMQKEVLGRAPSYTRDIRSTVVNAAMSGLTPADLRAAHKAVGSFETWRTTGKADDIVNRLRGEGVLQSTTSEAFRENRVFGKLAEETESKLGKLVLKGLDRVDERGMLGAIVPGKVGKAATKAQRFFNEHRVYAEEVSRVATYMKARKAGADHASAVEEVFSRWGKFDELTKLERNVLNRIMFFWAWQARSIPVSIRHLIQRSVRAKLVLAMTAGNATEDNTMPTWLRRMGGWVLGRNANGQVDVVNLGGTYFDPLISIMQGNFANEVMHGRAGNPVDAVGAAATDMLKSAPPLVQAGVELATKKDAFTGLDWWKDRNADKGISQAKAPTVLWWMHGDNPVSKVLGLQKRPIQGGKGGQYLVMDPRWAWLMTAIPGAETNMADVSAFFRSPDIDAGDEPMPKLSLGRGVARVAGVPLYEVPLEDGMRQVFELKAALTKSAYSLAGGSLSESGGRLVPSKTYRGTELRAAMERWTARAKAQGMTPAAAKRDMMDRMKQHYPAEWRVLEFQQRVEGWEQYLLNLRDGVMIDKDLADETVRNARKASTSRVSEFQLRKDTAEERKLFR